MVNWRRTTSQMQAATESVAVAPSSPVSARAGKPPRPRMMRQYDLVERVRSYNPGTNEDLRAIAQNGGQRMGGFGKIEGQRCGWPSNH